MAELGDEGPWRGEPNPGNTLGALCPRLAWVPLPRQGLGMATGLQWWLRGGRGCSEVTISLTLAGQPIEWAQCQVVALVEPPHAVALVVDVVGDVLQVLQVGAAREKGHRVTVFLSSPLPPAGCCAPSPVPCSPDQQVPQEGELAVRCVLHCKARASGQWVGSRVPGDHQSNVAPCHHLLPPAPPPRQECTCGCTYPQPHQVPCTWGGVRTLGVPLTFDDAPLGLAAQHPLAIHLVLLVRPHHGKGDLLLWVQRNVLDQAPLGMPLP